MPFCPPMRSAFSTSHFCRHCAEEGHRCEFGGAAYVRFGDNGEFEEKIVVGGVMCAAESFLDFAGGAGDDHSWNSGDEHAGGRRRALFSLSGDAPKPPTGKWRGARALAPLDSKGPHWSESDGACKEVLGRLASTADGSSLEECQAKCEADSACVAVTAYGPNAKLKWRNKCFIARESCTWHRSTAGAVTYRRRRHCDVYPLPASQEVCCSGSEGACEHAFLFEKIDTQSKCESYIGSGGKHLTCEWTCEGEPEATGACCRLVLPRPPTPSPLPARPRPYPRTISSPARPPAAHPTQTPALNAHTRPPQRLGLHRRRAPGAVRGDAGRDVPHRRTLHVPRHGHDGRAGL